MSAIRKFELIASDEVPEGALTWNGWKQRKEALSAWRKAVFYIFGARGSVMRVAWVLSDLFAKHGYAYASDGYLSKETFLSRRHVQEAIAALANGGAICRAHVPGKKTERRIFPSSKILAEVPPKFGGMDSAEVRRKGTAEVRHTEVYKKRIGAEFAQLRPPRTAFEAAMRYADARDRNLSISPDLDARGPQGPRREQHQQEEVQ